MQIEHFIILEELLHLLDNQPKNFNRKEHDQLNDEVVQLLQKIQVEINSVLQEGLSRTVINDPERIYNAIKSLERALALQCNISPKIPSDKKAKDKMWIDEADTIDLMDRMFFANALSRLRRQHNLSIKDLEKHTEISNPYLSVLERAKKPVPTLTLLRKFETVFDIELDIFIRTSASVETINPRAPKMDYSLSHQILQISEKLARPYLTVLLETAHSLERLQADYELRKRETEESP